jgi:hypothetical protein
MLDFLASPRCPVFRGFASLSMAASFIAAATGRTGTRFLEKKANRDGLRVPVHLRGRQRQGRGEHLKSILRVVLVEENMPTDAPDQSAVLPHQSCKRIVLAILHEALEQLTVGHALCRPGSDQLMDMVHYRAC